MKPFHLTTIAWVLLVAALIAGAQSASAQQYPIRPIRMVVPFAPGGTADLAARIISGPLRGLLGQSIVVDNRPGAGAVVGADIVAKSRPDGYTLLYATPGPQITNPYLMKSLPYDAMHDFASVAELLIAPNVLAVHPGIPAKSVRELIDFAKTQPGKLNFSSSGIGASSHLSAELFKTMAGIQINHVPYKGTAPAMVGLIAGNVQMSLDSIGPLLPHIQSGVLRALGVTSLERSPLLPEVPAVAETLPGFDAAAFNYIAVRAGTPRPIVARLNKEINTVLRMPEVRERFYGLAVTTQIGTPESLDARIKREAEKWKKVIEFSGAKAE